MSFESYATLLNRKLVLPSARTDYIAVERGFWTELLAHWIAAIPLDEAWYCQRYGDVAEAIQSGLLKNARQHYCGSGYFEHRLPYAIAVDARWYVKQYDDVSAALSRKLYSSAQNHFEDVGFKEGRLPYPDFSLSAKPQA